VVKNLPAKAGDLGSIPGSGRFPGEENSYPLQYICLENPIDRGAWRATVHGVAKELDTTEQLTLSHFSTIVQKKNYWKDEPHEDLGETRDGRQPQVP